MENRQGPNGPTTINGRIDNQKNCKLPVIRVVGVGGAGCNAVARMIERKVKGAEFIAINTDLQVLLEHPAPVRLAIGSAISQGLGTGGKVEVGWKAADAERDAIARVLEGSDMVFVTAGMGGGTGTGAAPVVAEVARELGALCVAVVTRPFSFEGKPRHEAAASGIEVLRRACDSIVVIDNDRILDVISDSTPALAGFGCADVVLANAVAGISEIVSRCGVINIDMEDTRVVMQRRGAALFGMGEASGPDRALEAARAAVEIPLLEGRTIEGGQAAIVNVTGGPDLKFVEVTRATQFITDQLAPGAEIFFGVCVHQEMEDRLRVVVVATGFPDDEESVRPDEIEAEAVEYLSPGALPHGDEPAREPVVRAEPASVPPVIDVPASFEGNVYVQHPGAHGEPAQACAAASGDAVLPDDTVLDQPAFARAQAHTPGFRSKHGRISPIAHPAAPSGTPYGIDIDTPPFLR